MRAFLTFLKGLWQMSLTKKIWTLVLAILNVGMPFLFLQHLESEIILGVFFVNVVALTSLTALLGYTRLVSLGHALWIPLIYFLWTQRDLIPANEPFGMWIRVLMSVNGITLMMDAVDVIRYVRGDRQLLVRDL